MQLFGRIQAVILLGALTAVTLANPVPEPQPQQSEEQGQVYRAYTPGQYDGQQAVIRTQPRLVAVRPGGGQILRAVNGGAVKRVRVVPATAVQGYEQPLALQQQLVQQPAYYIQRAPAPSHQSARPQHVVKASAPARPAYQSQEEAQEDEYPADPNPQYNFSFDVKDDELTNYQNRQEERDGGVIKGSYSVVDPDGYVRTVTYTADPKNGFQAKVVREPTDVKVKFPVPTPAPEEEQQNLYRKPVAAGPAPVRAQYSHPQYQSQGVPVYSQQQAYSTGPQPTYVVRRIPAGAASVNQPRVVKVLRAQ